MEIFNEIPELKHNTAVALGFFDGVHLGHREVIAEAVNAKAVGLEPVCLTFAQSPRSVLTGVEVPALLSREDKLKALETLGVEIAVFSDFSELMNLSAEDFVRDILIGRLRAKSVVCGFNYRFGKNGAGDSKLLGILCEKYGANLTVKEPAMLGSEVVSSTLIRNYISVGNVERANAMLGRAFGFSAEIQKGKRLGRVLGIPTVNQNLIGGLAIPRYGVYASSVTLEDGSNYCGVTNIGVKPTVGANAPLSETWMPEYMGGELYGQSADVRLLGFIRPERRFQSLEELSDAVHANAFDAKLVYERQRSLLSQSF